MTGFFLSHTAYLGKSFIKVSPSFFVRALNSLAISINAGIIKTMSTKKVIDPLEGLAYLYFDPSSEQIGSIPNDAQCFELWDNYAMVDSVREHSLAVADYATALANLTLENGHTVCVKSVRAAALLHDVAKSYTIFHGGSHAQIGASWVVQATGNRRIAQGVALHVHWPFALPQNVCILPFLIIYADKRMLHDKCVSLHKRYEDLLDRYAITEQHKISITMSYQQGKDIENALSTQLGCELDAYTFDSGRMVLRA